MVKYRDCQTLPLQSVASKGCEPSQILWGSCMLFPKPTNKRWLYEKMTAYRFARFHFCVSTVCMQPDELFKTVNRDNIKEKLVTLLYIVVPHAVKLKTFFFSGSKI